jgi:hypothetical protein
LVVEEAELLRKAADVRFRKATLFSGLDIVAASDNLERMALQVEEAKVSRERKRKKLERVQSNIETWESRNDVESVWY